MKSPSEDLFNLIKSLTKSEKRYIKVHAGKKDLQYMKLLDAVAAQKKYDEAALKEAHASEIFVKNLPVHKRYLYQYILKMLARFQKAGVEENIREGLAFAKILWDKELGQQAFQLLQKNKKKAYEWSVFELMPDLFKLEKQILARWKPKSLATNYLEDLYLEEKTCLERLHNINDYWFLNGQLFQQQVQIQKARTPEHQLFLLKIFEDEKLQDFNLAKTLESKIYFLQANATYFFTIGEPKKAMDCNQQLLKLLDENPAFLQRQPERYFSTLHNYLIDCFQLKQFEDLRVGLKKLQSLAQMKSFQKIKNLEVRIFRQRFLLELNTCLSSKTIQKGIELLPELKKGLEQFKKQIPKHDRVTFQYLAAYFLFQDQQFDAAQNWLLPIVQDTKEQSVKEIYTFSRILHLLIHFELQHFRLLESLIISTRRYLRNRRAIYETEQILFQFFQKMLERPGRKRSAILIKETLIAFEKLNENPKEIRVFQYIDLISWLKKKN